MIPALDLTTLLAGLVTPAPAGADAKRDLFANLMGDAPVVATSDAVPAGIAATAPAILPKLKVGEKAAGDAEAEPTAESEREGEGESEDGGEEAELPPIIASLLAADAPVLAQPVVAQPDTPIPPQLAPNPAVTAGTPVQSPTIAAASIMLAPQVARQAASARLIDEDVSVADPLRPVENLSPDPTAQPDPGFRREAEVALPATARAFSPQRGMARADLPGPAVLAESTPIRPALTPIAPLRAADAFLAALVPHAAAATEALQPTEAAPQLDAVAPQLDLAHEGEWLDRLAKDIARTANPDGSLRFRLNPEHLGSLQVEVSRGEAGAAIRLTTETESARQIITEAQPRLIAEARAQGLRVAETHVDLGQSGQERSAGEQQRGDQQRGDGQHALAGDPRGNRGHGERSSLTGNQPNGPKQDIEAAPGAMGAARTSDRFA